MSLIERFSSRTLCVGLAPGQFTSAIRRGSDYVATSAFQQAVINPLGHWQPLLNIFQSRVQQVDIAASRLPITVVLSSHWCRMMMVPWTDAMLKDGSAAHFLQTQYVALYGDDARDWVITTDDAPYGQPRLACAIERGLQQELQRITMENKRQCRKVEPLISAVWHSASHLLGADTRVFAIIEEGQLILACAMKGRIVAIQSQSFEGLWAGELTQAWKRWTLRVPELSSITQVSVLNLTGKLINEDLPHFFKIVTLPAYGLDQVYRFLTCSGGR